ncbi:hypothetical protein A1O7_03451 [Cladophialophora yegresii CBS 114405]|uniref:Uncharacterized protein n=1 Tax=Cladophialophora yegresii CBS 114405 TaxID=1182544 RepID=W9W4K1_9EURO|nr:uncharacterized protein A1O7_03451 [Cladophialophora yegresii CBS 114405]EXJ63007.1 hypothetical protein A1O7_03451 [Cladophialophora yegresii CBS 114405]
MSLRCPYGHIPYSAWRLDVLRTLFLSPEKAYRGTYARACRSNRPTYRRNYSDSQTPAPGDHVPDVPNEARTGSSPASEKRSKNAGPTPPFNPYSVTGLQAVKDLLAELQAVSKKVHYGNADKKSGTDFKTVVIEPPADPGRKKKAYKRIALDSSTEHGPSVSRSPVVRWVDKAKRRRREQKIHPSYHHIRGLKNNPWAEILASPIRACQGSGARLPVDLLLDLAYVKSPQDEKVYLLPATLADLDALEAKMAPELKASQRHPPPVADEMEQGSREDSPQKDDPAEPPPQANTPVGSQRPSQPQSRLFLNHTFLTHINDAVTQPVKKTFKDPSPTGRESVPAEVVKLIHFQGREAFSTAQHYLQNKRRFVSGQSGTHDTPSADQEKDAFNLSKLQWQIGLPSRIVNIMRQRVLVALSALAESESAAKTQGLTETPRAVIPLPFPKNGLLNGDELRPQWSTAEVNHSATTEIANPTSKIRRVGSKSRAAEDTTASEAISSTSTSHSEHAPSSSPSSSAPPESTYQRLGHPEWLPGSIFLHTGTSDFSTLISSSSSSSSSSSLPALPTDNPLIPPMLSVMDMHRFPVFSLDRLFSHGPVAPSAQHTDELNELLSRQIFQPAHTLGGSDHLLFVRSLQGPAKTVIEEVWRLWRYLGGTNMDVSFFEVEDIESEAEAKLKVENSTVQREDVIHDHEEGNIPSRQRRERQMMTPPWRETRRLFDS